MRRMLHENSLSIVMFGLFLISIIGQGVAGYLEYNQEQQEHGQSPVGYVEYLYSPNFGEAVFENWESEFLQMGAYVILTVFLRQKGSPESKKLNEKEPVDDDPRMFQQNKDAPWPVRRGGLVLKLYEYSLSITFLLLFILSFVLHAVTGAREHSQEQIQHGMQGVSVIQYIGTSRFWFESLQNWQSEFLSVGVLIALSIFLRQRGSPESKPVADPHSKTGK